ncbi:hypothetical protein EON65_13385 [archaeon]|nr:MAG: hypothetical protein EON65_13385 [archaeon]
MFNKPPSDHSSYLQNLFTFLTQYATSDPMNLGLQPNKLELLYKSSHKQKLSSEWWVEMMKLPGVYYYQTEDGSLNGPNVVLSAKPFAPIDLEVFRGNLLQLCTAHEYFPLKILEPTKLKTLYICRYGRPVDVDYQGSGSWLDVLTDQPGILLHSTSRGSMVDTLVCCVGRLTYPVRPSLHFLPIFAQIVSLQLNELIVMLSKSSQALDMKTLRAMYLAQFKKPLKRLITHSTLFSYVGGVVMHDGAYKYILPIEINHTTNVVRSTTGPGNSPKLKRAQYLLARRQDLLKSLDLPVTENPSNATSMCM